MGEHLTAQGAETPATAHPLEPAAFSTNRPGPSTPVERRRDQLHICYSCGSELVQPTDWAPAGTWEWAVSLRCPECEWRGGGVYDQEVVASFDEELDRGMDSVLDDLTRITRANLQEWAELFLAALWAGHLLPEDF